MLNSVLSTDVYIFKAMLPIKGYDILREQFFSIDQEALKARGESPWLLRESNITGMLTIDFLKFNETTTQWECKSRRMALTADGWVCSSTLKDTIKVIEQITAESASNHQESLNNYIQSMNFLLANRLNPLKHQQTTCGIYTTYSILGEPSSNKVNLSPGLAQAISCELSRKPFKKPVVINSNMQIRVEGWNFISLYQGRSYEESELIKLKVPQEKYYRNFVLEKVIDRLGCEDATKIEKLSEERLLDPVFLETIENPIILPSGHSFGQKVIDEMIISGRSLRCPNTGMPFNKNCVVTNINLENFMREWPSSKAMLIGNLDVELSKRPEVKSLSTL